MNDLLHGAVQKADTRLGFILGFKGLRLGLGLKLYTSIKARVLGLSNVVGHLDDRHLVLICDMI